MQVSQHSQQARNTAEDAMAAAAQEMQEASAAVLWSEGHDAAQHVATAIRHARSAFQALGMDDALAQIRAAVADTEQEAA